jgi:hypothetical protein
VIAQDVFDRTEAEEALERALGRRVSTEEIEGAFLELSLYGFVVEKEGRFTWAIPLLRDAVRSWDLDRMSQRLAEEIRAADASAPR